MQIHQEGQGLQERMLNTQQYRVLAVQRNLSLIAVRSLVHNTRPYTLCYTKKIQLRHNIRETDPLEKRRICKFHVT